MINVDRLVRKVGGRVLILWELRKRESVRRVNLMVIRRQVHREKGVSFLATCR